MVIHTRTNQNGLGEKLSAEQERVLLEGLPPTCWAAYVLLGKRLVTPDASHFIDGRIWLPPVAGLDPEKILQVEPMLHDVIGLDLGKAQIKAGGIDEENRFSSTILVDAYCKARAVQHEFGGTKSGATQQPAGMTTWTLLAEQGVTYPNPSGYWVSRDALHLAEKLPASETHIRIKQTRIRELVYAALVEQLIAMGRSPVDRDGQAKTHYLVLSLGLPYSDITPLEPATREAIRSLYGDVILERENTHTGSKETWRLHITIAFASAQTRGTDDAWGLNLRGEPSQHEVVARTIIDPGGGDSHVFHVTEDGMISFIGEWIGKGTIELAEALIEGVKRQYGVTLSEPEAQLALYTREIRGPGGKIVKIDDLIGSMQSKRENMLTRLSVSEEMKSTLVIFTSGGTALLHDDLKKRLQDAGLVEGIHFIVVPASISTIMNVIGLTARGLYKGQAEEQKLYRLWIRHLVGAYNAAFGQCLLEEYQRRSEISQRLSVLLRWQEQLETVTLTWTMIKPYYEYLLQEAS